MDDDKDIKLVMTKSDLRDVIRSTVDETLIQIGVDATEPLEMQKDFQYLRSFRESTEAVQRKGILTLVAIFVTSVAAAILLGAREYFSN